MSDENLYPVTRIEFSRRRPQLVSVHHMSAGHELAGDLGQIIDEVYNMDRSHSGIGGPLNAILEIEGIHAHRFLCEMRDRAWVDPDMVAAALTKLENAMIAASPTQLAKAREEAAAERYRMQRGTD